MKFSERYGYKSVKDIIQTDSMDEPLRNGLWNLLKLYCWDNVNSVYGLSPGQYLNGSGNEKIKYLCERLWFSHFKKPLDELSNDWGEVHKILREYFFGCEWVEVYDFIEFVAENYSSHEFRGDFTKVCNCVLEEEMSAYRFIDGVITRITEKGEIAEIEEVLETSPDPVRKHLRRSLELMSDRENPDYRNSIKESISAVESFVKISLKTDQGTLGNLMERFKNDFGVPSTLVSAINKLYGYASNEGGIRHGLDGDETTDFTDAKFVLVVCSAFINFAKGKMQN